MAAAPVARFCSLADGSCVAFAERGEGRALVMVPGWLCHLEQSWSHPAAASALEKLAASHRFVWYDRLGCGLSDRAGFELSLDNDVAQLTGVLDAAGVERADLVGYSFGVPPAARFAARFPERVNRLMLYSGFARGASMMPRETLEAAVQLIRADWTWRSACCRPTCCRTPARRTCGGSRASSRWRRSRRWRHGCWSTRGRWMSAATSPTSRRRPWSCTTGTTR
jgi:pimeloyl-ACP methyl ester carboxylesterase